MQNTSPHFYMLSDQRIEECINYYPVLDLVAVKSCSFYWGEMERQEAERLLCNEPDGTYLLRDSIQMGHLFISFRLEEMCLHIPIQQWIYMFGFQSANRITGSSNIDGWVVKHVLGCVCWKCSKPPFTRPLRRTFTFSLKDLSRVTLIDHLPYIDWNKLPLPKVLKNYLIKHQQRKVAIRDKLGNVGYLGMLSYTLY